jgi:hypothetical protein
MGLLFVGGDRVQRGRGIGGILKWATKLFSPLKNIAKKVLTSDTGKKVVNAVKEQAVDSSINIASDIASGKNFKESLTGELNNAGNNSKRKALELGLEYLKNQERLKNEGKKRIKGPEKVAVKKKKKTKLKNKIGKNRDILQ